MADPLGSLEKIVKIALRIKEAVDTVRQNKEECQQIRTRAVRVSSLLSRLPETGMTADPAMCGALEDLEDSLRRAHALVAACCQENTTVCVYCTAGRQARRLRRVQDDISQKVMLVVFATNIQTTIILESIRTGEAQWRTQGPATLDTSSGSMPWLQDATYFKSDGPPAEQAGEEMIETPVGDPCDLSDDDILLARYEVQFETNNGSAGKMKDFLRRHPVLCRSCRNIGLAEKPLEDSLLTPRILSIPIPRPSTLAYASSTCAPSAQGLPLPLPLPPPPQGDDVIMGRPLAPLVKPATLSIDAVNELKKATKRLALRDVKHSLSASDSCLRKFSLSELEAATHHFSMENMIGSGASATVYKGILHDGLVVAIKKFQNPYVQSAGHTDELHLVSKLKHKNIVKLTGYGTEVLESAEQFGDAKVGAKEDKETSYVFVEEYMPNWSLNKIISGLQLDWTTRFLLIQGIAQGLCYLHKHNIVHLDVKPSNILLAYDMYPKITDFRIARMLNHKRVEISSDIGTIAGTLAYMPPEYITDGMLSKKHDVYGFGVTLLEVISNMSRSKRASIRSSIQWAWEARQARGMAKLLEPSLFNTLQLKEIERCVEVGLLCTQFDLADRPDMVDALEMLRGEKALRTPVRPGYTKEPAGWVGRWSCLRVRL